MSVVVMKIMYVLTYVIPKSPCGPQSHVHNYAIDIVHCVHMLKLLNKRFV